jgi:hypothetical protein
MIIQKSVLERVSFDPLLQRVRKSHQNVVLPYEMEQLREWLNYTIGNQSYQCLLIV